MPRVLSALVACLLLATGCYTVLRHPEVRDAEPRQVEAESCTACHTEYEMSAMEYGLHHRLGFYGDWAWWDRYYRTPWWYDDYWYWRGGGGGGGGGGVPEHVGKQRRQGESIENERPRLQRRSRATNPPPAENAPPAGQTGRGDSVAPPSSPPPGQQQDPPAKEASPERRPQGESTKNERPPRPRP